MFGGACTRIAKIYYMTLYIRRIVSVGAFRGEYMKTPTYLYIYRRVRWVVFRGGER